MPVGKCEVCGKRKARDVCQECGRQVCETCLEPYIWLCSDCYRRLKPKAPAIGAFSRSTSLKLFFLGFSIMFVGIIIIAIATVFFGVPSGSGAFVWIPPLPPIGFGVGPYAFWMMILSVAVTVLGIVLFAVLRNRT